MDGTRRKSIIESMVAEPPQYSTTGSDLSQSYLVPNFEFQGGDPISDTINEFRAEALKLSSNGRLRARIYKGLDVLGSISILILAATITFVSLGAQDTEDTNYASGALAIVTGMIEGAKRVFRFSTRGNTFEQVANKAFYLAQRSRRLANCDLSEAEIFRKLDEYYIKLGNLDMSLYDSQVVNIQSSNSTRQNPSMTYTQPISGFGTTSLNGLGSIPARGNIQVPRRQDTIVVDNTILQPDTEPQEQEDLQLV